VDLERAVWAIPAAKFKTGKPLVIPLAPQAVEVLEARKRAYGHTGYVFPSTGKTGHLVEPKAGWARLLKRAGLENLRLHDLRHTLASWQVAQGQASQSLAEAWGITLL
jgi:integrase